MLTCTIIAYYLLCFFISRVTDIIKVKFDTKQEFTFTLKIILTGMSCHELNYSDLSAKMKLISTRYRCELIVINFYFNQMSHF